MNNKILFCATVDYHFKAFHLPYIKWFKEQGWTVDIAASGNIHIPYIDNKHTISIKRSPLNRGNINAYRQLKQIMIANDYDIIHCHTPLGGILTRLAARTLNRQQTTVIYTAHGFHFYKGAPLFNWLLYYPVERYMSRKTDCLITINQEDYEIARKHNFRTNNITYIPGVGVDTEKFTPMKHFEKIQLKQEAGYHTNDILLFNAGEFNHNKNQSFLIQMMSRLIKDVPNAKLLLAGEGKLLEKCRTLINQLGMNEHVKLLGFQKEIDQILPMCDISVAASVREGLPVNIMESMACGLPIVAVNNRGNRELIHHEVNGYMIDDWDEQKFANQVKLLVDENRRHEFGRNGRQMIMNKFSIKKILRAKSELYKSYMDGGEDMEWIAP